MGVGSMKRAIVVLAAALGLLLAWSTSASAAADCTYLRDNFDRSDSLTLGSNWTEQASDQGDIGIESAQATNPIPSQALATFNSLAGTFTGLPNDAACVDVATNGTATVQYVAIVLDYGDVNHNIFVKVQVSSSSQFDSAYFYVGNNGDNLGPASARALTPFTSGRIAVSRSGDDVT